MAEAGAEKNGWGGRWERLGLYALALVMGLIVYIYRGDRARTDARLTSLEIRVQVVSDLQRDKMHLVQKIEAMEKTLSTLASQETKVETDLRVLQAEIQINKAGLSQLPDVHRQLSDIHDKLDRLRQRPEP